VGHGNNEDRIGSGFVEQPIREPPHEHSAKSLRELATELRVRGQSTGGSLNLRDEIEPKPRTVRVIERRRRHHLCFGRRMENDPNHRIAARARRKTPAADLPLILPE